MRDVRAGGGADEACDACIAEQVEYLRRSALGRPERTN